jgi:protein tyrosine/serine phosphatase
MTTSRVEGVLNFRDLGGLRAAGGRVRPGVLFRSDTLQALTVRDVAYLVDEVGLELVVDLRIGAEAAEQGRGPLVDTAVCYLNVPLPEAPISDLPPAEQTLALYRAHASTPHAGPGTVVKVVSALSGSPTLVHCAMGKDRTGLVVALLLKLVGVADDDVVADYLRTAQAVPELVRRFRGWPHYARHMESVPSEVYGIHEDTMVRFLSWLDVEFGGAAGWATARGVDAETVARLRRGLVVPDEPAG